MGGSVGILHYRLRSASQAIRQQNWSLPAPAGTNRSHTISGLSVSTTCDVQIRAKNSLGTGGWSTSGTGTTSATTTTTTTTTTTSAGGGGSGFVPGAPPRPPRPVVNVQTVEELFRPVTANGSLVRVWGVSNRWKRWTFHDPDPTFAVFNTLKRVYLSAYPPEILIVNADYNQQFRGCLLRRGWNHIPMEDGPPARAGNNVRPNGQVFSKLVENGTVERVWWLEDRTQEWKFFDPAPDLAPFNTLKTVNLAASPPVVVAVNVTRKQQSRDQRLYRRWNYLLLRQGTR